MSQRLVESILGRLITDAEFRVRFLSEPDLVCQAHGWDLTPGERSALMRIDSRGLQEIAEHLDPMIVRALTVGGRAKASFRNALRRERHSSGRTA